MICRQRGRARPAVVAEETTVLKRRKAAAKKDAGLRSDAGLERRRAGGWLLVEEAGCRLVGERGTLD